MFKHGYSLETSLEFWPKKTISTWVFVFFKKLQDNSAMYLDFKKWLQVFLLNASLGDIEFYNFSVDQSWYNGQSVQLLRHVWLFVTPWTAAHQASLSITNPCRLLELKSIKSVMPPNHLILCRPLLLLPSSLSQH